MTSSNARRKRKAKRQERGKNATELYRLKFATTAETRRGFLRREGRCGRKKKGEEASRMCVCVKLDDG